VGERRWGKKKRRGKRKATTKKKISFSCERFALFFRRLRSLPSRSHPLCPQIIPKRTAVELSGGGSPHQRRPRRRGAVEADERRGDGQLAASRRSSSGSGSGSSGEIGGASGAAAGRTRGTRSRGGHGACSSSQCRRCGEGWGHRCREEGFFSNWLSFRRKGEDE